MNVCLRCLQQSNKRKLFVRRLKRSVFDVSFLLPVGSKGERTLEATRLHRRENRANARTFDGDFHEEKAFVPYKRD